MTQLTLAEMSEKLHARQISAVEAAQAFLDRIDAHDSLYGAYLTIDKPAVLASAEQAQQMLDSGEAGVMTGIPVAVKDNMSTQGLRTTCASKILENYIPPYDATVVSKLKDSGAIVLGKTNLDEFAMGTSNENSAFQLTRNPWDPDLVPGGSSGGSAVAVSAELAAGSLGSDTGGSIRLPASLTGIVGFKPTYGRVSRYGLIAFGSSLDQIGPFGKTVEDVSILAEAISGHDPLDSTSLPDSQIRRENLKKGNLRGLKAALPKELFSDDIQEGVRDSIELAIDQLTREGVEFTEVSVPSILYGVTTYYIIAPAEASSNLARFDGIRFGPRSDAKGHIEVVAATRGELFGPEVKLRIMVGTYALSAGYYDAYYHRAQQVRGLMAQEFETLYQKFDVVVSPASPVVAFPIGEVVDQMQLKLLDFCTIPANMGGFPSLSIPCGMSKDLPVGLLVNGPVNGDEKLLQIAYSFEQAFGRDYRRPPIL